jgi:hypothetical protein
VIVRVIVVKPFEPLPGGFRKLYPETRHASSPGGTLPYMLIVQPLYIPFILSCVTYLSERDHNPHQVVKKFETLNV